MDVSKIPYTEEDESSNLKLLKHINIYNSKKVYEELLIKNFKVIDYLANCFNNSLSLNIEVDELKRYLTEGFYLACRGYNFRTSFIEYAIFYMEQFTFYQVYTEYFLTELPITKRVGIQKLYHRVLKNLDKGSGLNYYDAIIKAADEINMPLSTAINLMSTFLQLSVKEPDEYVFLDELDKMSKWIDADKHRITDAPLAFILTFIEAQMQEEKDDEHYSLPYSRVCTFMNEAVYSV